ncbi:MAG TPA: hypothetical protein VGB26_00105 [Nitrospiria bacterium]|jgi:hypothetical protein
MSEILPTLVWTLILASFSWFFMVAKVFSILRKRHQMAYDALVKSSYLFIPGFRKNMDTIRFLRKGHYRSLNDSELTRLCNFMKSFLYCYVAFFMTFVGLLSTTVG